MKREEKRREEKRREEKRREEKKAVLRFMIHVIMDHSANIPLDLLIKS